MFSSVLDNTSCVVSYFCFLKVKKVAVFLTDRGMFASILDNSSCVVWFFCFLEVKKIVQFGWQGNVLLRSWQFQQRYFILLLLWSGRDCTVLFLTHRGNACQHSWQFSFCFVFIFLEVADIEQLFKNSGNVVQRYWQLEPCCFILLPLYIILFLTDSRNDVQRYWEYQSFCSILPLCWTCRHCSIPGWKRKYCPVLLIISAILFYSYSSLNVKTL